LENKNHIQHYHSRLTPTGGSETTRGVELEKLGSTGCKTKCKVGSWELKTSPTRKSGGGRYTNNLETKKEVTLSAKKKKTRYNFGGVKFRIDAWELNTNGAAGKGGVKQRSLDQTGCWEQGLKR